MKPLIWTSIVAAIVGLAFAVDGALGMREVGTLLDFNAEEYRNATLSLGAGAICFGIAILAGLLALHARAIGAQTRAALVGYAAALETQRVEELRREQASRLRVDHRS